MTPIPPLSTLDRLLASAGHSLHVMWGAPAARRATPAAPTATSSSTVALTPEQARLSSALMRVNHVGEVCAQALYQSQALASRNPALRAHFAQAAQEELDHLAWTRERLDALGGRISLLTPLWYGGAFAIGSLAGLAGDRISLGFVVETERQVEQHLASHLDRLPAEDTASRAVVAQMKEEEARHAEEALAAGAQTLPGPAKAVMRLVAKLMTSTAHYV